MSSWSNLLLIVTVAMVAFALFAGLFNMARGGEGAAIRSQILMRWRVGLQFLALILIVVVLFLRGR